MADFSANLPAPKTFAPSREVRTHALCRLVWLQNQFSLAGTDAPCTRRVLLCSQDVLSTLGFFFGDPATPEKLKDYSEHHAMTYRTFARHS